LTRRSPEQAPGVSEQDVSKNVMPRDIADGELTTVQGVAAAALLVAASQSTR
jgi:hypothetical protein